MRDVERQASETHGPRQPGTFNGLIHTEGVLVDAHAMQLHAAQSAWFCLRLRACEVVSLSLCVFVSVCPGVLLSCLCVFVSLRFCVL